MVGMAKSAIVVLPDAMTGDLRLSIAVMALLTGYLFKRKPRSILAALGVPGAVLILGLGRVAVRQIAAGRLRIIRHHPGRIEPDMNFFVLFRMAVLLRVGRRSGKKDGDEGDENRGGARHN